MPNAHRATLYAVAGRAQVSIVTVVRVFQHSNKVASGISDRVFARIHGSVSAAIPT